MLPLLRVVMTSALIAHHMTFVGMLTFVFVVVYTATIVFLCCLKKELQLALCLPISVSALIRQCDELQC